MACSRVFDICKMRGLLDGGGEMWHGIHGTARHAQSPGASNEREDVGVFDNSTTATRNSTAM